MLEISSLPAITVTLRPAMGATAVASTASRSMASSSTRPMFLRLRIIHQSSRVLIHCHLSTYRVWVPRLPIWVAKLALSPSMMATMAITVITPMTMPRVVRKVRRWLAASEERPMRSPFTHSDTARRQAFLMGCSPRSRAHRPRRLQRRHLGPGAVAQHPPVHELDGPRAAGRQPGLVGDQDDGVAAA